MTIANEEQLLSCTSAEFPPVGKILAIAPHPDDEVFGCGGTLALLKSGGAEITTIIVSDGALGGTNAEGRLTEIRAAESRAAARVLGLDAPHFWGLPDRGLAYGEVLIGRIIDAIRAADAELVFLPSPADWHPDHQTLAFAGAEAARRLGGERRVAFYEVSDPLPCPNLIHDISAVEVLKQQAMQCFVSQLGEQPYAERIAGINRFRAMHLGPKATSAEAFNVVTAAELAKGLPLLLEGPLTRRRALGFAASGSDMPLVSVIIRSMDRPTLDEALDSLALQTYSNIEVVLVNAKGPGHRPMAAEWGRLPLRLVATGTAVQRARAANLGLDAARGEYLMFLDDDDWFEAGHVQKLVEALRRQPEFRVAYTGVRCVDAQRNPLPNSFDAPFDALRVLGENFIPIHAVLFSRELLELGCRLDETIQLYEDWDFWLQLSRHGEFLHVGGLSAIYRITGQTGFGVIADPATVRHATLTIYRKWLGQLDDRHLFGLMQAVLKSPLKDGEIAKLVHAASERDDQIAGLQFALVERDGRIGELGHAVAERDAHIAERDAHIAERDAHIAERDAHIAGLDHRVSELEHTVTERDRQVAYFRHVVAVREEQIAGLIGSTSWQLTKPLRFLARLLRGQRPLVTGGVKSRLRHHGKQLYWRLPAQIRTPLLNWSYRHFGTLFKGMPHYEQWRGTDARSTALAGHAGQMLLIDTLAPATQAAGRIAVHLHMFYEDLADEFADYLRNMPFAYDLYVSVASDAGMSTCRTSFSGLPGQQRLEIEKVPNRGRDIAPMFCTFGSRLKHYDYVAHLHSKKSLYNKGATEGWRQYLCGTLLGSEARIRRIIGLMQAGERPRGIVYPQNYHLLPYAANTWLANKGMGSAWCARLGIHPVPQGYFDFPAGSMFWARGDALRPLFDAGITLDDFAEEAGQTDGTFAHCLERLLVLSSLSRGFEAGIIKDLQRPTWSAWGFQQYAARTFDWMCAQFDPPAVRLIAFDIFDTLLCRPLLDAESVKAIVAERIGGESGKRYRQFRAIAEGQAREAAGRDIGMDEIFARLGTLTGLGCEELARLRKMEEEIETASVAPRPEALALYRRALTSGKPIALISDMFLSRATIENILDCHGIVGWNKLFLSNEIGLRKDTGQLYDHVFAHYGIRPAEMLMVGDNERSDLQIPCDKGAIGMHVLKPVEFARGLPRLRELIDSTERSRDLQHELTLGLVVQQNFSAICYSRLDAGSLVEPTAYNIGYSIVGPLLTSLCQWLADSARRDGIDRLYFLAREGQLIKRVYDVWAADSADLPQADYLVVSRRTTSVPMIRSLDDILNIAASTYFPNTIGNFLFERYGLQPSAERWAELTEQLEWHKERTVEVFHGQIDHLRPLLMALQGDICARADAERTALLHYLGSMGLEAPGRQAVVDVGYGATIQGYLNRLVANPLHGYYMITDQRSAGVVAAHDVIVRGCFLENVEHATTAPQMYLRSFELEKFLSSSDAQIVYYELDAQNRLRAHHREVSGAEDASVRSRDALQEGVIRYAQDARNIRMRLFPGYQPSCDLAKRLYEAFLTQQSQQEIDLLKLIALDDHYCGRGVVN